MKSIKFFLLAITLFVLMTSRMGLAYDSFSWEYGKQYCHDNPESFALAMSTKLLRGVTNVLTGWMEIPRNIYVTSRDEGLPKGLIIAPFQGIFVAAARTLGGAVETAFFYMPAPGFYEPMMERPLVWSEPHAPDGLLIFDSCCEY